MDGSLRRSGLRIGGSVGRLGLRPGAGEDPPVPAPERGRCLDWRRSPTEGSDEIEPDSGESSGCWSVTFVRFAWGPLQVSKTVVGRSLPSERDTPSPGHPYVLRGGRGRFTETPALDRTRRSGTAPTIGPRPRLSVLAAVSSRLTDSDGLGKSFCNPRHVWAPDGSEVRRPSPLRIAGLHEVQRPEKQKEPGYETGVRRRSSRRPEAGAGGWRSSLLAATPFLLLGHVPFSCNTGLQPR